MTDEELKDLYVSTIVKLVNLAELMNRELLLQDTKIEKLENIIDLLNKRVDVLNRGNSHAE